MSTKYKWHRSDIVKLNLYVEISSDVSLSVHSMHRPSNVKPSVAHLLKYNAMSYQSA